MRAPGTDSFDQRPETQHSLEQSRQRQYSPLSRRELTAEGIVGAAYVAAAAALVLLGLGTQSFNWPLAAMTVAVAALCSRVEFEVGSTYTMPIELALVPMLFILPPAAVPACMALAIVLGKVPEAIYGKRPPGRLLLAIGDSWFTVGPALVLTIASPGAPDGSLWPIYLAALAAQFAFDFVAAVVRELLHGGDGLRQLVPELGGVPLVDAMLAPVGLAVAFAAYERPWMTLLVLPLAALMTVFGRQRRAHVDQVLELSRTYRGTARVLGAVVEADDAYTGLHSAGVVDLSIAVADEMGLDGTARRNVEFGALLHDVGKIAVPKEIINKPGPLDDDEWEIMRRHTIEGQRLLDEVGGFMRDVGRIVRASHEHFNGGGYPDGLAGEEIPLEARIVSACDAYSAMTTDRSYRRARLPEDALEELRRCAGTQFDPAVVVALETAIRRQSTDELAAAALLPDPWTSLGRTSAVTA